MYAVAAVVAAAVAPVILFDNVVVDVVADAAAVVVSNDGILHPLRDPYLRLLRDKRRGVRERGGGDKTAVASIFFFFFFHFDGSQIVQSHVFLLHALSLLRTFAYEYKVQWRPLTAELR